MDAFELIRSTVREDLHALDELIIEELASNEPLVEQIGHHIISSGGKRLRPLLSLLFSRLFDIPKSEAITAATIIEFIHTATLLHDDVVDHAPLRRGKQSAHHIWGPEASVLVGDFLYSRAFQLMVRLRRLRIMELLAETTNTIAEGEVMQLAQTHNEALTEVQYLNIITAKTATLFSAAAQLGPILADASVDKIAACGSFGFHLGVAFQLTDDALDYQSKQDHTGKTPLKDLQEGKLTLPLIYTLQQVNDTDKDFLTNLIKTYDPTHLTKVQSLISASDAIRYTYDVATQQSKLAMQALNELPRSTTYDTLAALADFAIKRTY